MTDKEIVQALRYCGHQNCFDCAAGKYFGYEDCLERLVAAAADLIERLTAENAALREKGPRWIPVTERMPLPGAPEEHNGKENS